MIKHAFLAVIGILLMACSGESEYTTRKTNPSDTIRLFERMDRLQTGILFSNDITEDKVLNFYTYSYMYNGSGVAVGDINNDGLDDVYFCANQNANKLYLNKGQLKFEDITSSAGVAADTGFKTGVLMEDFNGDGWLDIYVCRSVSYKPALRQNLLYINNQDNTFTEKAVELGLKDDAYTTHVTLLDYDLDGDLDLYMLNHSINFKGATNIEYNDREEQRYVRTVPGNSYESDRIYRNDNGIFTEVSKEAGIENGAFSLSLLIHDFNEDGYPDIYIANDFMEPDVIYINQQDGTFKDEYWKYFRHLSNNSMGSDLGDINNDGYSEVMVLDMFAEDNFRQKSLVSSMVLDRYRTLLRFGYGQQLMRNTLQLSNRNQTFSEIGLMAGVATTDWSWAPLLADFDNDGFNDLFITNGYRRDISERDFVTFKFDSLLNSLQESKTQKAVQSILAEISSTPLPNYMYRNLGDLTFEKKTDQWGFSDSTFSSGATYSDLDNDGDLDILINNLDMDAMVYRNLASEKLSDNGFLKIRLLGSDLNKPATGAKVMLHTTDGQKLIRSKLNVRGYLSSVTPVLHFGLGSSKPDKLEVFWPDGKVSQLTGIPTDTIITVSYQEMSFQAKPKEFAGSRLFVELEDAPIEFRHQENEFVEFKREGLLPHSFGRSGPPIAKADVNSDGLTDVFFGGAAGQGGKIYLQAENGSFEPVFSEALHRDSIKEDVDAAFFDFDLDGDQDLYVVSGGNEVLSYELYYQDRLYLNDGLGSFTPFLDALPLIKSSGTCVQSADIDNDGDIDLFIGGGVEPDQYPRSSPSLLLINDGGKLRNKITELAPDLENFGIIHEVSIIDMNGDNRQDIVLASEWKPLSIFIQDGEGKFVDRTKEYGLHAYEGWWSSMSVTDLDKDGDMDIIGGNLGLNTFYTASKEEPLELFVGDFDDNDDVDAIMTRYILGERWPVPTKDNLLQQIPQLRRKYVKYNDYARAKIEDILGEKIEEADVLRSTFLEHAVFLNENGKFVPHILPQITQVSPIYCQRVGDFNMDGRLDLVMAGNNSYTHVERGPLDAGNGYVLLGDGKGGFEAVWPDQSGLFLPGDIRDLETLQIPGIGNILIATENNGWTKAFRLQKTNVPQ